jgi:hypothetical protein
MAAPSAARAAAIARPMPLEAPVTSAVLPFSPKSTHASLVVAGAGDYVGERWDCCAHWDGPLR